MGTTIEAALIVLNCGPRSANALEMQAGPLGLGQEFCPENEFVVSHHQSSSFPWLGVPLPPSPAGISLLLGTEGGIRPT